MNGQNGHFCYKMILMASISCMFVRMTEWYKMAKSDFHSITVFQRYEALNEWTKWVLLLQYDSYGFHILQVCTYE